MNQRTWILSASLCLATAGAASAAEPDRWSLSFEGGYLGLQSASKSAKAVFDGSSGGGVFGGSLRFGLSRSFFVGAAARVFNKDGERVFVADAASPVFKLGHPLKVRLVPVYGFVGYRFRPQTTLVPYVAVGGGVTSFREESTVGGLLDSQTRSKGSAHFMAGLDYRTGNVGLGLEALWSTVPNSIGLGGVSQVYGETNLGGFSLLGRFSFRR